MTVGVVLIAHAPLASALGAAARHVYGCAPEWATQQVAMLDVPADADIAATVEQARGLVQSVEGGTGVLILTDAFGATPGNIAAKLIEAGRVAVVAGVNLPMLLRTLCYRDGALADTVAKALTGGAQGVMQVAGTPVQNQGGPTGAPAPSGAAGSPSDTDAAGHDYSRLQDQQ
jgi:PTS system ascorbate-specific IIA component